MARENFYSQMLCGAARKLYDSCIDNITRGVLEGRAGGIGYVSDKDVEDVITAVMCGNPEYFYLNHTVQVARRGTDIQLRFSNKYGGNISEKKRELDAEIAKIASKVKICGSTYDRLCRISAYLGERIRGSDMLESRYGDAYGALVLKEARCEGYAKAAKLIMDRVGIKSEIAVGDSLRDGKGEKHAWNIAFIGDRAYGFDFTWNDTGDRDDTPGVEYLFLSDAEMGVEHFPEYKYPACTDASQTFWARNNGIIRSRADLSGIRLGHVGKNFLAAIKFYNAQIAAELKDAALDAVMELMHKSTGCTGVSYMYNKGLNVLSVYPRHK